MSLKIIIISSFLFVSCNQKENHKSNDTIKESFKQSNLVVKLNKLDQLDTITIFALPLGNKMIVENFNKIGSNYEVSEYENNLLENGDSKFLLSYQNFFNNGKKPLEGFYKFSQKNIIDFGLNYTKPIKSISTYQGFYAITKRLPDVNGNKVFIANSIEKSGDRNNIINCIDLVIINSNNQIIDNLNLSHKLNIISAKYYNHYDDYCKYFFIDKDYTIHIKYFTGWGDSVRRVFAYVLYKIEKDGLITRYFTDDQIHYKSEVEEGEIKNHKKNGIWKEALSDFKTNYCVKKYRNGKIEDKIEIITIKENKKDSLFINKDTFLP